MAKAKKEKSGCVVLVGTYKGDQLAKWRGWYNYPISGDGFSHKEHKGHKENEHTDLLTPNGVREDVSRVSDEQIRLFERVNELWLFKGTKDQRNYKATFVGVKTREELIRDYGYLSWEEGKGKREEGKGKREEGKGKREEGTGNGRARSPSAPPKPHGTHYALFRTQLLYRHKGEIPGDAERVIIRTSDFAKRSPKIARQLKAYLESPERSDPDFAATLAATHPDTNVINEDIHKINFKIELCREVA